MLFLFGMELNNYLTVTTSTAVIVDKSTDGDFLRIDFNMSFPSLPCEFASIDVSNVLGTGISLVAGTLNSYFTLTYPILAVNFYAPWCYWSKRLVFLFSPFVSQILETIMGESSQNNERKVFFPSLNSFLYDPEMDGRILLAKFDCTEEVELCRRHHIQAYPSIRIFRKGSDVR
ncbi:protein disulfide isomerase-like 5-4 [Citrus sinensis]|uniref:Protein disulfide isomerase-like 5-4 n=1 Tax=Citrus sinensis TaxID=2711 RepID=A0ACB8N443_CITSI|nr:protein disulfide isomerase-like 5-4 [Citrus sinensis]